MTSGKRRQIERLLIGGVPVALLLPGVLYAAMVFSRPALARMLYQPQDGDIAFQSLPPNRLSRAIEGATRTRLSHCGLVAREEGRWIVLEAYRGVEATPLGEWLARGQDGGFLVCRLQQEHQRHVPAMLSAAREFLGRPYDSRYRWDDEEIYCSELVYKAYERAAGDGLGKRVRLGELNWKPYRQTIEHYEQGPPPLDRELITPRDLAEADQLAEAYRFGL